MRVSMWKCLGSIAIYDHLKQLCQQISPYIYTKCYKTHPAVSFPQLSRFKAFSQHRLQDIDVSRKSSLGWF